jgi:hypothetical protein
MHLKPPAANFRQFFGTQVSLGPLRLVNRDLGTQMALALGELITFLVSETIWVAIHIRS